LAMTLSPGVTQSLLIAPGLALRATYHDDGLSLDGVLFHDRNGDGLQTPDELGLAGARVIDPDVYQYFVPFRNDNLIQSFNDEFDDVRASALAAYDGTIVTVVTDTLNPGSSTTVYHLNAGETAYIRGSAKQPPVSIHSGADVSSTLPVQVQVRAGSCRAAYSG